MGLLGDLATMELIVCKLVAARARYVIRIHLAAFARGNDMAVGLKPFRDGIVVNWIFASRIVNEYNVAVIVFTLYWIIPLAIAPFYFVSVAYEMSVWKLITAEFAARYVADKTHFLFSVYISLGSISVFHIIRRLDIVIRHSLSRIADSRDLNSWYMAYHNYRKVAFSTYSIIFSLTLTIFVIVIFLDRISNNTYRDWWGNQLNGISGIYFLIIVANIVFWGVRGLLVIASASLIIAHISKCKFKYQPLRGDGCNGLRPLGSLIVTMWIFSLFVAFAIYEVFSAGYLGIEKNVQIWIIAFAGTLLIPIVAVYPLYCVTTAIRRSKNAYLCLIERGSVVHSPPRTALDVSNLSSFAELRRIILDESNLPFKGNVVLLLSLINAVQVVLSIKEIVVK